MKFFGNLPFDERSFNELCCKAQIVKRNPVREVLRSGNFFIKHDYRRDKNFLKEYENALFLEQSGIPVVRHLGCVASEEGNYLVTEALENAVEVDEISARGNVDSAFCDAYVKFINLLREKRLRHRDLHGGNVLYVPEKNFFALVDVKDVSRGFFPFYSDSEIQRLVTEIRQYLPRKAIYEMLEKVGVRHVEKFFAGQLRADYRLVTREWEKRRHQISTGYPKFTRIEGHFILDRKATKSDFETARRYPAPKDEFFAYYFLKLLRIPLMRLVGYDLSCKELLLPSEREYAPADLEIVADLRDRLRICGIESSEDDWRTDHAGHVVLADWQTASRSLW